MTALIWYLLGAVSAATVYCVVMACLSGHEEYAEEEIDFDLHDGRAIGENGMRRRM